MQRQLELTNSAEEDLAYWKKHSPKTVQRIGQLITGCMNDPFRGIGKPEPLRGSLSGYWSRRINRYDRMIYNVEADKLVIIALRYHYEE